MIRARWPEVYNLSGAMDPGQPEQLAKITQALEMSLMPNDVSLQDSRTYLEYAKTQPKFLDCLVWILSNEEVNQGYPRSKAK